MQSLYSSPEEFEAKIEEYFDVEPLTTVGGLAYHLGFVSRDQIEDYKKRPEYSSIIKRAILRIQCGYEKNLYSKHVTGSIFALKVMGIKEQKDEQQEPVKIILQNGSALPPDVAPSNPELSDDDILA